MRGVAEQVAVFGAVSVVIAVAGIPLTVFALPDAWRRAWPAVLPVAGLATLLTVLYPLSLVMSMSAARPLVTVGLVVCIVVAVARRSVLRVRPSAATLATLLVGAAIAAAAFGPSLDEGAPIAPGIVSADSFFYASNTVWLTEHTSRELAPDPRADSFFAPAWAAKQNPLRVGSELTIGAVASVLGLDGATVLPAFIAFITALGALAAALAALALGVPAGFATLAALLWCARPEWLRLGLDSAVAQQVGMVLLPLFVVATWRWLCGDERRWLAIAGVCGAALVTGYPEYGPFAVLALTLAAALVLVRPAWVGDGATRAGLLRRVGLVALTAGVLSAAALPRSLHSLSGIAALPDRPGSTFLSIRDALGLVVGPGHVYDLTTGIGVLLAAVVVALALSAPLLVGRRERVLLLGLCGAVAAYVVLLRFADPFPQGLLKAYGLFGPFVLLIAVSAVAALWTRHRPLATAGVVVLLVVVASGAARSPDLVDRALASPFSPSADEVALRTGAGVAPDGRGVIALEGTDYAAVPMGRLHWAVYFLRRGFKVPVGYDTHISYMLSASYENPRVYVDQRGDEAYRGDYRYVLSLGESQTHAHPVRRTGNYLLYRRNPIDVLATGPGWAIREPSANGTVTWQGGGGPSSLRIWAPTEGPLRMTMRLVAPAGERAVVVRYGERVIDRFRVGTTPSTITTPPFAAPAGRSDLMLETTGGADATGRELGVGLLETRATPAAG